MVGHHLVRACYNLGIMKISSSGFTIVELMVTILVMAVLIVLAIPNYRTFILNNQIIAESNQLIGDLQFAREEAIRRGKNVNVTAAASGGAGDEFGGGYIVWFDSDNDGTRDAGEELRVVPAAVSDVSVNSVNDRANFIFNARGGVNQSDVWDICDQRTGETGREITLLVSGLIRINNKVCP